jgi:hypothetical protein
VSRLTITTVAAMLMLSSFNSLAASPQTAQQAKESVTSQMDKQMLEIEQQVKKLQVQMQTVRNVTNRQERYRLLLGHIRSTRHTLDLLRGMKPKMAEVQKAGRAANDLLLNRRQAIMEQMMDMMLIMLEQVALFQEPSLQR